MAPEFIAHADYYTAAAAGRKDHCTLGLDGRYWAHSLASLEGSESFGHCMHAVPATVNHMQCNVPSSFLVLVATDTARRSMHVAGRSPLLLVVGPSCHCHASTLS
jgi:hypothetical protein